MSVKILIGDVRARLADLDDASIDAVCTSPPYWGLRDYGVDGQLGLEPTLTQHLDVMVDVFARIRPKLKPWATVWLNYGDCYATEPAGRSAADSKALGTDDRTFRDKPFSTVGGVLKPKDLCMIPNRLAIALQEAGWWVRSEIVWGKPNPMPDSRGAQRPSTAHEKIFLLGHNDEPCCWRHSDGRWVFEEPAPHYAWKNRATGEIVAYDTFTRANGNWFRINHWAARDQYYEQDAVAVPTTGQAHARAPKVAGCPTGDGAHKPIAHNTPAKRKRKAESVVAAVPPRSRPHTGLTSADEKRRIGRGGRMDASLNADPAERETRYLRNYEPAVLAVWQMPTAGFSEAHFATFPPELAERCILAGCPAGGRVLDPFFGAGTVGLVADALGRDCTGIELNPDYAAIAARRLKAGCVRVDGGDSRRGLEPLPLEAFDAASA